MKEQKAKQINFGKCTHLTKAEKKRAVEILGKEKLADIDRVLTKFHQSPNIYIKK